MRLPTAAEFSPSSRPRHATTAVTAVATDGELRRSTRRSQREPGSTSSRAIEYIARAVSDWAAIPQARKAAKTTAANGFVDHAPNAATTAVWTGSASRPATTAAGSGCASVVATALRTTSTATLSSAIQIARGTCRAALRVSSDTATQASKPMNTHPPTASAASIAAPTEPPDSASAPSVCSSSERSCVRNASSSASPTPTDATISAAIPTRIACVSRATPNASGERTRHDEHHPRSHDPVRARRDVQQRQQPRRAEVRDRRVRHGVRANRHPAAEPPVRAAQ